MHVEIGEGSLREVLEADDDLAGRRIGGGGAGELDVDAEAIEGENQAEAVAGLGFAEVDGTGKQAGKDRGFDGERTDLRVLRALGFFGGAEAGLGVGAGLLAVGDIGGEGEAGREGDGGGAKLGGRGDRGALELGDGEAEFGTGGRVGGGGGRGDRLGGVEGELVAVGGRRVGRFGVGGAGVVGEDVKRGEKRGFTAGRRVLEKGDFGDVGGDRMAGTAAVAFEFGAFANRALGRGKKP